MRVLALDQAAKCGYAVFINGKLMDHGLIDLSKLDNNIKLRAILKERITNLIIQHNIDTLLYENIYAANRKTYNVLAKLQGTIQDLANQYGIHSEEVSSRHWRNVLIDGKASKEDVRQFLLKKYKKLPGDLDENTSDAIAIGLSWVIDNK